jgi:hypothetical protein
VILFLLLFLLPSVKAQTVFYVPSYPYQEGGVVFADYDQDGDNDILIGCEGGADSLVFLMNDGYGNFERSDVLTNCGIFIYCKEMNNDGLLEIVSRNHDYIFYYKNVGPGALGDTVNIGETTAENRRISGIYDMNEDGLLDVVYYSIRPNIAPLGWGIFYNNGDGTFNDEFLFPTENVEYVKTALLNNDNRPDALVSSALIIPGTYLAFNNPSGFTTDTLFSHSQLWIYNNIIDMDNDSDNDLIFYKPYNDEEFLFYENVSDENFINRGTTYKKIGTRDDVIADLNGDGYPDMACTSPTFDQYLSQMDSIYIFINNHNWGFKETERMYMGEYAMWNERIFSGDLNGDNRPELLVTGYTPTANRIRILWNDGTGHFVDTNTVSLNEQRKPEVMFNAYPNPFGTYTIFRSASPSVLKAELYGMAGNYIKSFGIPPMSEYRLDAGTLPAGMYFVKLQSGNNIQTIKLIHY